MNYVIANITDEQVTKGEKYPILSMHDGMINIDVHGTMICFNAEDKDFTVCLNDNENKVYIQEEIISCIKQAIASCWDKTELVGVAVLAGKILNISDDFSDFEKMFQSEINEWEKKTYG